MAKRRVFLNLAAAAGYIGLGMLLGYTFSDKTTNTGLWLGSLLVVLGAVLLGMYISARSERGRAETGASSSGNIPFDPTEKS
jgi:peptidoglycan/LPS O-acetylase OafA/YrhL